MNLENYKKRDLTFSMLRANIYAMLLDIPIIILFVSVYILLWHENFSVEWVKGLIKNQFAMANQYNALAFLVLCILGIIIHELIHGLVCAHYSKDKFKSIKFGVAWKALTPYCHCKEPLDVRQYRIGIIMPCLILGIIPTIIGIISGSVGFFVFGLFFTIAAGGDLLTIIKLRKENSETLVLDHPSKCGCEVYDKMD